MKRIAIIGGGAAGLASATLLAKKGHSVVLFESHTHIGGCGGFFRRAKYIFDVGATTLSPMSELSPLTKFLNDFNIHVDTKNLETPMTIYSGDKKIFRYKNREKWIKELERHWPDIDHRLIWEKIFGLSDRLWKNTDLIENIFTKSLSFSMDPLLLGLNSFWTMKKFLDFHNIYDESYIKFLDEQLIISTQAHCHDVNFLIATIGLTYPEDMVYPMGGISNVLNLIEKKARELSVDIQTRTKVEKIIKSKGLYRITSNKGDDEFDIVISTLPLVNTAKLYQDRKLSKISKKFVGKYSALTFYIGMDDFLLPEESLYHQVHLKKGELLDDIGGSLFFSFSRHDDNSKAPKGKITLTSSTHIENFNLEMNEEDYEKFKKKLKEKFLVILKKYFPNIKTESFEFFEMGTPRTFKRFTSREEGLVGGIPHVLKNHPLLFPKPNILGENFYLLGDNIFPGQGVASVVLGAQNLIKKKFR
tara:strand:+ start:117311 stop:118732 length:1422 start_codon:yes stop_codon:yes gene_type:complete